MTEEKFDVFISYNSKERDFVETIASYLIKELKLRVWFDDWDLIPGGKTIPNLENGMKLSNSCAVFLGKSGIGDWQQEEIDVVLGLQIKNKEFRVIPVLIPGGKKPEDGTILGNRKWIKFKGINDQKGLKKLIWGITGKKVEEREGNVDLPEPTKNDVSRPPDETLNHIKKKIRRILSQDKMKPFREALINVIYEQDKPPEIKVMMKGMMNDEKKGGDTSEKISDMLISEDIVDAICPIMDLAFQDCSNSIKDEGGDFDLVKYLWKNSLSIIGRLVMLSVDYEWVHENRDDFEIESIKFPVETEAGVEIVFTALKDSFARFGCDQDGTNVYGKGWMNSCGPDDGWETDGRLLSLERQIYRAVYKTDPPAELSELEIKKLNARIGRLNKKQEYHYICIRTNPDENAFNDIDVYHKLCSESHLPALKFVQMSIEKGDDVFIVSEIDLNGALLEFFENRPE
ncbi:hypothetical protein EPICR_170028 [Candidatus Desulfarcum epimagneticum]|uniref:TIR domain-containing protein n=1 Tax=uncultured Desulfobacteraceae bacterium TaxID=218296 RepID=A0A484HIJ3_9BACT|nr:hypothetical protein EPICR_170028 [uncultured Desulfobacteraceae bacterium]